MMPNSPIRQWSSPSKAFDCISHYRLLEKVSSSNLHLNLIRWLSAYLHGRQVACVYQDVKSKFRIIHTGVPQGSVWSPVLFNFFVANFPQEVTLTESFVDDFHLAESATDVGDIEAKRNSDLAKVSEWAHKNFLKLSVGKSSITLFTPDTHQSHYHPQVFLDGQLILLERRPTILGVTLDTHISFTPHVKSRQ